MTSITLSNSEWSQFRNLYLWSLRRHMGIAILYTILLFLAVPGVILLNLMQENTSVDIVYGLLGGMAVPITMLFTLIFSLLHFNYMHKKRRADLFGALPLRRNTMLLARIAAAATHILLPLLLNSMITGILMGSSSELMYNQTHLYRGGGIVFLQATLLLCLSVLAALVFSALIAVCCGTTLDTIVSILVINGAYPVLVFLVIAVSASLLPGVEIQLQALPMIYTLLCPYGSMLSLYTEVTDGFRMSGFSNSGFWTNLGPHTLWWIGFVIVILALALLLNRRRKSETAETAWAFAAPNIVIRIVTSATAGLGLGYLVAQLTYGQLSQFLLGMVIGSLIAHLILELIYSRGLRKLLRSLPAYGGTLAILLCFVLSLSFGLTDMVNRIPVASEVKQVTVMMDRYNNYTYSKMYHMGYDYPIGSYAIDHHEPVITSPELIDKVTQLHEETIKSTRNIDYNAFQPYRYGQFTFSYYLKDGTTLKRTYSVGTDYNVFPRNSRGESLLGGLLDSEEFKKEANGIFHIDVNQIDRFSISDLSGGPSSEDTLLTATRDKQALLEALRIDLLNDTMSQQLDLFEHFQYDGKKMLSIFLQAEPGEGEEYKGSGVSWTEEYFIPEYYTNTNRVLERLRASQEE